MLMSPHAAVVAMLDNLTIPLVSIDEVLKDIVLIGPHGNLLEYEMLREQASITYSYPVICKPDTDGVWRIVDF